MKKINYLYFIGTTLMWFVVSETLSVLAHDHPVWLLLLPVYGCWYVLSAPLFYVIRKRKGVRDGFQCFYCMRAQWTTFWVDLSKRELAYLCLFNPFQIYYLPLNTIQNARTEVRYSKDGAYINWVNCSFEINGRRHKIRVETSGRGYILKAESDGKAVVDRTQKFADLLNGS